MTRIEANKELLKKLNDLFEQNPDLRFTQALVNAGYVNAVHVYERDLEFNETSSAYFKDEYYLESSVLLERVKKFTKHQK